jgi:lipopolysaccharide export LptBFGC system permease protein LptF
MARYTLREAFFWMLLGLAGSALIFLVTQLVRVAPLFAGAGDRSSEIFIVLSLLTVPVCGWSLTPAFAVAVFATFGRMSRDGELLALDAAGVPRAGIASGPMLLAFSATLLSALVWLAWAPSAQRHLRARAAALVEQAFIRQIPAGEVIHPVPGTTFFADRRGDAGAYLGVFFEDARDPRRWIQVAAEEARLSLVAEAGSQAEPSAAGTAVRFHLSEGTAFMEAVSPRAFGGATGSTRDTALTFGELRFTLPLGDVLEKRLDFLPGTMAEPTSRLLGPPPPGTSAVTWRFALWRRVAGPVGTLLFASLSLFLAFGTRWQSRGRAVVLAGALFFAFHLAGRLGESMMWAGYLCPPAAALLPSAMVSLVLPSLVLFRSL